MMKDTLPTARDILSEEMKIAHWHDLTEPKKIFDVLDSCLDRTYQQIRSACWGNKMRTIACDVLFKEAQESVALARASVDGMSVSRALKKEKDGKENQVDWIQPLLLLLGTGLGLAGGIHGLNIFRIILSVLAALCVLAALMREMQRLMRSNLGAKLLNLAAKVFKKAKWLKLIPGNAGKEKKQAQAACTEFVMNLNPAALEEACLRQMDVIDSNLALFQDTVQKKDQAGTLLPLVQTLLQEKYTCGDALPESVEAELAQYLHENDLHVVDYDREHAAFFQTQPMDETFTIFPAILDGNGHIIEYGVAGVREE